MRLAIIHDYLAQAGGAERVVEAMHGIWPDAPLYTSVYDPKATFPAFRDMDIRTSFLQRWVRSARLHKFALPLYPLAFEQFDMSGYDVVLSSTTGFAKGVITGPETCHISYCHTPARFAWRYHEYVERGGHGRAARHVLPFIVHFLRAWDYASAQRVDHFVANSQNTARRIRKFYGRESEVLPPPVDVRRFQPSGQGPGDYLLVVSRLVGYKRADLAVEACTRLGLSLKVVGDGPELSRLRGIAGPTVKFLGRLPDDGVTTLLAGCRALLFPGEEDFGLTPLEAMASGRPVVAFAAGGALETVHDGRTGLLFHAQTAESLMGAIECLRDTDFPLPALQAHAAQFDIGQFQSRLKALVESRYALHKSSYGQAALPPSLALRPAPAPPAGVKSTSGE